MTPAILRQLRESYGVSRQELAADIGYQPEYLRHVEMGRKVPSKRFELLIDMWLKKKKAEKSSLHP